jgi:glyoxylase-like metal-dependent hydrolase (beta-lactamase superfamily II)
VAAQDPVVFPLHLADVSFPEGHPQASDSGPVLGFAVRHGEGVLLFDTGIGTGHAEIDRWYRPRVTPLEDALREQGLAMDDVTAIANSHLHFDHCGGNTRFAGVQGYVRARELEAAANEDYTVAEWIGHGELHLVPLDDHAEVEVAPDVVLIGTPGHTPGHQSCVIATAAGPVVLAGQAVYTRAEWEGSLDPRDSGADTAPDVLAYSESVRRLRRLEPARMHFAHDLRVWTSEESPDDRRPLRSG